MKQDYTEIVAIIDRSGSMQPLTTDTIGGFNGFLQEQKNVPGWASMTRVLFNTRVDIQTRSLPLEQIHPLNEMTYQAGGSTALNDAVGMTIEDVGKRLSEMKEYERPAKVVVLIITDGLENASKEYTHEQVASMIKHQQDVYGWEFLFMGANMDAQAVASTMNISAANAANFDASPVGVHNLYESNSKRIAAFRTGR